MTPFFYVTFRHVQKFDLVSKKPLTEYQGAVRFASMGHFHKNDAEVLSLYGFSDFNELCEEIRIYEEDYKESFVWPESFIEQASVNKK